MVDRVLDRVIHGIYEAALTPSLWTSVLTDARDLMSGQCASIIPSMRPSEMLASPGLEAAQAEYGAGWWPHDHLMQAVYRGEWSGMLRDWELLSPEFLRRDPYYQEFRRLHGMGHVIAYTVEPFAGDQFVFGVQFPLDHPDILDTMLHRRFMALASHATRAITISSRLSRDGQGSDLGNALSALRNGVALLDHLGSVVFANAAFEDLAKAGLRIERRRLRSAHARDQSALDALIRDALDPSAPGPDLVAITRPDGGRPLLVRTLPLPVTERIAAFDPFRPRSRVLVLVIDPSTESHADIHAALRALGLTSAEARVAALVGTGRSGPEVVDILGNSQHTVRSQIKASMVKLGVAGQGELVALVARLSSVWSAKP